MQQIALSDEERVLLERVCTEREPEAEPRLINSLRYKNMIKKESLLPTHKGVAVTVTQFGIPFMDIMKQYHTDAVAGLTAELKFFRDVFEKDEALNVVYYGRLKVMLEKGLFDQQGNMVDPSTEDAPYVSHEVWMAILDDPRIELKRLLKAMRVGIAAKFIRDKRQLKALLEMNVKRQ